jgi:mannose-1-phosphate guanylyltransferase
MGGDRTLIQQTMDRIEAQVPPDRTWVITSAAHREVVAQQLSQLSPDRVIGEPCPRDTAPCVVLGAALIAKHDPEGVMIVIPSDHVIEPSREFVRAVQAGAIVAEEHPDALVVFGVIPTWPSTGYGYVHKGDELPSRLGIPVYRVKRFREKPNDATARDYVASREYFWNAGVFLGKVSAFLRQFAAHEPNMLDGVKRIVDHWDTPQRADAMAEEFPRLRKISFDFAVMEKCPEVLALAAPYQWDDIGSWLALERLNPQDVSGNTVRATHVGRETSRCIIVGDADKVIATLGVNDLVIVQDGDCFLVAHKDKEGEVKQLVEEMKKRGLEQHL